MRRILFALILLAATSAFAQSPAFSIQTSTQVQISGMRCPVALNARLQGAALRTEWVTATEDSATGDHVAIRPKGDAGGVHVTLSAPPDKALSEVTVAVFYHQLGPGLVPVGSNATSTLRKTFTLTGEAAHALEGSLLLGLGADVRRVRILSIEYSDGSSWQAFDTATCAAAVSHVLPVTAR